jgi:hypothetical protein
MQPTLWALTLANAVLLVSLLWRTASPVSAQDGIGVLRGSALEIVDTQGHVRASITVNPPEVVDGRAYPESVLLRLRDPHGGPGVKLDVSSEKAALRLAGGSGAVELRAGGDDHFVRVTDGQGQQHRLGR